MRLYYTVLYMVDSLRIRGPLCIKSGVDRTGARSGDFLSTPAFAIEEAVGGD